MKKVMLIIAGCLFMITTATFAQTDTTNSKTPDDQNNSMYNQNDQGQKQDMVQIQSTDLPQGVQQTLQDSQYKGWENGTFYKSTNGDMFFVEVPSTTGGESTTYRFRANGDAVDNY